jgi:predicted amidohydrolase YtcJ
MAARLTAYVVVAIVAATLIAGLIVGAQRDDSNGPVDLIIHNAKVYTADTRGTIAEAVAIRGNQILRVGSAREINRLRRPQTVMIDANGAAVLPGFNDSHAHLIEGGLALESTDFRDASTPQEIQQQIRAYADANPDRPWITGRGWHSQMFGESLPTRQLLDAVVKNRPVQLVSADGHSSWVNTKALHLAEITKSTPDPLHGVIVRDLVTGEPTGVLKEAAMSLVGRLVPKPTMEERARALRAAIAAAHRNGITSVQDAGASKEEFDVYIEALRNGDLQVRVYAGIRATGPAGDIDPDQLDRVAAKYPDDPLFKTGAVSIELDGAIETHAAAMLEPYANRPSSGTPWIDADALHRIVRRLDARGWQIMTDASGDRAVHVALNAYEHAARINAAPSRGRRHRIEHAVIVAAADAPRFGSLGVIASMQPFNATRAFAENGQWSRNIGTDRLSTGWPHRSIVAARGRLAFGSNWPMGQLNPLLGLHTAVNRTTAGGSPEGGWEPSERLALKEAINAYTSTAAWASFDEQRKGRIAPEMLADLVVLSNDIFSASPALLASTAVEITIFDGKIVYRRSDRRNTN